LSLSIPLSYSTPPFWSLSIFLSYTTHIHTLSSSSSPQVVRFIGTTHYAKGREGGEREEGERRFFVVEIERGRSKRKVSFY
jgi:hypothetical protein